MGFAYTVKVENACDSIINNKNVSPATAQLVADIKQTMQASMKVTGQQAKTLGSIYKAVVNGGRYIKHDWW